VENKINEGKAAPEVDGAAFPKNLGGAGKNKEHILMIMFILKIVFKMKKYFILKYKTNTNTKTNGSKYSFSSCTKQWM
jgi:hypothetical protein